MAVPHPPKLSSFCHPYLLPLFQDLLPKRFHSKRSLTQSRSQCSSSAFDSRIRMANKRPQLVYGSLAATQSGGLR